MNKTFTWIPFYTELAKALLRYKEDRKPLVDFIYSELSQVGGKSLVDYLHMRDGSKITDIDPFSVFAIFNRNAKWENRTSFLQKFKDRFSLTSEVPTDFDGIPTVNPMRAFFFSWEANNPKVIHDFWDLFENVVLEKDISICFNQVIANGMPKNSLTMTLYWISPNNYLALDQRNRSYLQTFDFNTEITHFNYDTYQDLIQKVRTLMQQGVITCKSFPELSYQAWTLSQTERIWMFNGNEKTFLNNELKMGSSAKGALRFEDFKSKTALGEAYREAVDNKDVTIPQMYWEFIHEVKVGDIVVVFETRKSPKPQHHVLYGWGRISSDVYYNYDDENPIIRKVEWNHPQPEQPIKETKTKNALYFHDVSGTEAANIMKLLNINGKVETAMNNSNNEIFINLLKTNKNLILTGAPGTGKTYMAKKIAQAMHCTEDEIGFVQFHPSYDYTDFVEGLRPLQKESSEVGFERKDGVFKEFCKKALKNLEDSQKTSDEIIEEKSLEDNYNELLQRIEDGELKEFQLRTGDKAMEVVEISDYNNIILKTPGTESKKTYTVSLNRIAKLAKAFPSLADLNEMSNIAKQVRDVIGGCNASAYWAVLREIYKQEESQMNTKSLDPDMHFIPADLVKKKKYVFIIDEINRGEISKIFGELFFSIDPGYRGIDGRVKTQYQNLIEEGDAFKEGFYVPENVYIVGTMNDIDRSVESMDFAMRRRFAWKEVTAEQSYENMIKNDPKFSDATKAEIKQRMFGLNEAIEKTEGLDKSYQIGAAYFRKYLDYKDQPKPFDSLWENHLEGLLSEYLRGNRKAEELLKILRKAYNLTSTDEQPANNNEG